MKIGFIYKFFPSIGGVERVMSILANEFVAKGNEVIIYSFQQKLEEPFYPLHKKVVIRPMPNIQKINAKKNIEFLTNEAATEHLDLFFNHDTTADSMSLCRALKRDTNLPIVTLHHGQIYLPITSVRAYVQTLPYHNPRRFGFYIYFLYDRIKRYLHHRRNIAICDAYVLLSEAFKRQLWTKNCDSKLYAIGNPLSFPDLYDIHDYVNKENLVVMVGRLSEYHKRFSLALKIWQKIEFDNRYKDWTLMILGDGPDRDFVQRTIDNFGLSRVKMTGAVNPLEYYQKAKILFMTSAFEGFPLVLNEAMQNACVPVAMNSFEALEDIVSDKKDGIIIPNNDIDTFVRETKELMCNASTLRQLATAARVSSTRFSPTNIAGKWLSLFQETIQQKRQA